jgi:hypothetical protein
MPALRVQDKYKYIDKTRVQRSSNITGNVKDCKSFNESSNLSLI